MNRWFRWSVLAVMGVLAAATRQAGAQVAPYAMFSTGHYSGLGVGPGTPADRSGGVTALGGTFGVYDDFVKMGPARLGADVRAIIENSSNSTPVGNKLAGGLFGVRLDGAGMHGFPFNPYVQAEIGGVGTNNGTSYNKSTSFAYQFQFGGDISLFPHVAARLEYGAGQLSTNNVDHTLQTFGVGLVVRLY
jgi:hypothetical protein